MHIRPFARKDIPQVNAITQQAFEKDELFSWLNPGREKYPDDLRRYQNIRLRTRLVDAGQYGFVAVTDEVDPDWRGEAEVVGAAFFEQCGENKSVEGWRADSLLKKFERKLLWCEQWYETKFLSRAQDPERLKKYMAMAPWNLKNDPFGPRWHLSFLCVAPKHQRRGIGGLLVQQGQRLATEHRLPLTLESSVAGRKLYLKNGFKSVGENKISETFSDVLMVWEPVGLEGSWLVDISGDTARLRSIEKS